MDGALPSIVMFGDPTAHQGETYRQEYLPGDAEDMGLLLTLTGSTSVPYGDFDNLVLTYDYNPLEATAHEVKYYAAGIGEVKTLDLTTGETSVLMAFTAP